MWQKTDGACQRELVANFTELKPPDVGLVGFVQETYGEADLRALQSSAEAVESNEEK